MRKRVVIAMMLAMFAASAEGRAPQAGRVVLDAPASGTHVVKYFGGLLPWAYDDPIDAGSPGAAATLTPRWLGWAQDLLMNYAFFI